LKANLAIEIDGPIHLARKDYDEDRTRFLESSGLKVLRFKNEEIEFKIDWVIEVINTQLNKINHLPNLPSGEGVWDKPFPLGGNGKGGN
jgi:very-short-patch-repair endonuclease